MYTVYQILIEIKPPIYKINYSLVFSFNKSNTACLFPFLYIHAKKIKMYCHIRLLYMFSGGSIPEVKKVIKLLWLIVNLPELSR